MYAALTNGLLDFNRAQCKSEAWEKNQSPSLWVWSGIITPISYPILICRSKQMQGFKQSRSWPFIVTCLWSTVVISEHLYQFWRSTEIVLTSAIWEDQARLASPQSYVLWPLCSIYTDKHSSELLTAALIIIVVKHWLFSNTWNSENVKKKKDGLSAHFSFFSESDENDNETGNLIISIVL